MSNLVVQPCQIMIFHQAVTTATRRKILSTSTSPCKKELLRCSFLAASHTWPGAHGTTLLHQRRNVMLGTSNLIESSSKRQKKTNSTASHSLETKKVYANMKLKGTLASTTKLNYISLWPAVRGGASLIAGVGMLA